MMLESFVSIMDQVYRALEVPKDAVIVGHSYVACGKLQRFGLGGGELEIVLFVCCVVMCNFAVEICP